MKFKLKTGRDAANSGDQFSCRDESVSQQVLRVRDRDREGKRRRERERDRRV